MPIYLDYNATTPIDPAVADAMQPYLREHYGNPSSAHTLGQHAHAAVETARKQLADLIGADADEIVFTSGGSEASNLALKGVFFQRLIGPQESNGVCLREGVAGSMGLFGRFRSLFRKPVAQVHIITSAVEHPATLQPLSFLQRLGCRVTVLPVDRHGVVDISALRTALQEPTHLVSIMHANNEVGTIQPIREIASLAHQHGALVHTDAAQSLGKVSIDVRELGVDMLSIAGHKLYAPKGVGALYVHKGVQLEPLLHGAAHELGRRAGTENVPHLVGFGTACGIALRSLPAATEKLRTLRDRLWEQLQEGLGDDIVLNGHPEKRLPNTLNVCVAGHIAADLLKSLPEIAASTGSACHDGSVTLSPVLKAMGVSPEIGKGAIRLSVGRFTTEEEVDQAAVMIYEAARASVPASV